MKTLHRLVKSAPIQEIPPIYIDEYKWNSDCKRLIKLIYCSAHLPIVHFALANSYAQPILLSVPFKYEDINHIVSHLQGRWYL